MEWILIVVGVFVVFFVGSLVVLPRVVTQHMRRVPRYTADKVRPGTPTDPAQLGLDYQQVWIDGHEGIRLHGWWIVPQGHEDAPVVVFLHGFALSKIAFLGIARTLADQGLRVLMLDHRAHGMSEGTRFTYGIKERYDVQKAADWLAQHQGVHRLGLMGVSVGSIVAAQAAALDPRFVAVVLQSPYTSLANLIRWSGRQRLAGLSRIYIPGIDRIIKKEIGINPKDVDVAAAVGTISAPKLVIAGEDDAEVPLSETKGVVTAARQPVEFWSVPGAGHNNIHKIAGDEYATRIAAFITQNVTQ